METPAARVPVAVGLNVTLMVQLAPAPTLDPQVLVWLKSPALAPVIEMPVTLSTPLPVLVRVTDWAALEVPTALLVKVRLEGETLTDAAVPVPERLTACGLPLALSEMESDAARLPAEEGVNVTLIVQLAPAATLDPQVFVWLKSPALVPVTEMLVMFKAPLPVLVRVTG